MFVGLCKIYFGRTYYRPHYYIYFYSKHVFIYFATILSFGDGMDKVNHIRVICFILNFRVFFGFKFICVLLLQIFCSYYNNKNILFGLFIVI